MPTNQAAKVYLVGAGPGDPGLISLRAVECLAQADLVLYDALVNPLLLRHTSAHAERTCRRTMDQDTINQRLVAAAQSGQTVVRLKGGDPFIFGRGSEEAAALAEAGLPYEIVPGITAATAAGEYAGISLTHRDHASAVAFVTGHEDPTKDSSSLDYEVLARFPGTLVFYMGLHRLKYIADSLIEAGKPIDTPAAVISRASTFAQRTTTAPLNEISQQADAAKLHAPSLIIVGDCVQMRETIAWAEQRPLFGQRIGITRPPHQAEPVIQQVLTLGGQPVLLPCIEILDPDDWGPVDSAVERLDEFQWIVFTSANGVRNFLDRVWEKGGDARSLSAAKIACIGTSTAAVLNQYHVRSDLIPGSFRAESLAAALVPLAANQRVLWPKASRGRDVLPNELRAAGAELEEVVVYKNEDVDAFPSETLAEIEAGELDWVGLSSPSIAKSFLGLLSETAKQAIGNSLHLASISPVTSQAIRDSGFEVSVEATTYTWNGIIDAIAAPE
ncbi:MAG: uroporphyrinogen-III C-methyltransferase [Planctomycetaceae bacterium]|nr:uroporphyrinogen-III C-methyltransferase [Planctomycetaceae bacterium]